MKSVFYLSWNFIGNGKRLWILPAILIACSVIVMIQISSISRGFNTELMKKIMFTSSHIEIKAEGARGFPGYEGAAEDFRENEEIKAASPRFVSETVLSNDNYSSGVRIIGIIPEHEMEISRHLKHLLLNLPEKNWIIVGDVLFNQMKLKLGDTVNLKGFNGSSDFKVSGTFSVGLYEYDLSFAYVNLSESQTLFNYEGIASSINIILHDINKTKKFENFFESRNPGIEAKTWLERNKSLVGTMKIEEFVMKIIFFLTSFLSLIGVSLLIFVNINERKELIGQLEINGMSKFRIRMIFLMEGIIIVFSGLIGGVFLGIFLGKLLGNLKLDLPVEISMTYGANFLPVVINYNDIYFIVLSTIIFSFILLYFITGKILRLDIEKLLKN